MYSVFEQLLKERNVKVSDVAKKTGIRQGVFSDWKMGRYTPKQDKLQKIADYFGVTIEYLMTGVEAEEAPYYLNADAREYAELLFHHPEYKVLFDAARNVPAKDIDIVRQLIERFSDHDE